MTELIVIRAENDELLLKKIQELSVFLARVSEVKLSDVAYTLSLDTGACALAIIADDIADLRGDQIVIHHARAEIDDRHFCPSRRYHYQTLFAQSSSSFLNVSRSLSHSFGCCRSDLNAIL